MDFLKRYINHRYTTDDLAKVKETFESERITEPAQSLMKHHWWNMRADEKASDNVDFDAILHKIHHSINLIDSQIRNQRRINWELAGKIAAILVLPLMVASIWGTLSYQRSTSNNRQFAVMAPQGQQSQLTLSDGTQVWLNSDSKLVYSGGYGKTNRDIKLMGEGYFKVAKNKDLPFQVNVNNITVTALGTAFNVDASLKNNNVKVTLVEGSVRVKGNSLNELLRPGQQLVADGNRIAKVQKVDTELYTSWHQGILVFKDELLEDILHQLEKRHDVTFVLKNEELKSFRYRGRLRLDYSILKTLEILRISTGLDYRIDGRIIELDKK